MSYSIATAPRVIAEALAAWELFRSFGFESEVLFFYIDENRDVGVTLRHEALPNGGGSIRTGKLPTTMSREHGFTIWRDIAEHMSEIPELELQILWASSVARQRCGQIAFTLIAQGVVPPLLEGVSERTDDIILRLVEAAKN